jgi:signal transduction histidine kinase
MNKAVETGVSEDERWHLRKDGSHFFASGLLHSLFEDGKLTGYVKIVRDLTERIELEAALENAANTMDIRVEERTSQLGEANKVLRLQIAQQQRNDHLRHVLMQRVINTQEDERKRISRDLHDHLGQELTGLRLRIQLLKDKYAGEQDISDEIEALQTIAAGLDKTVDFLTWELRPASIDELGLEIALQNFVKEWSEHFNIPVKLAIDRKPEKRLAPVAEINLYRIAQESLNNVAKHAKASAVNVKLADIDHTVSMIIEDDGVGFPVEEKANTARGIGLIGLGERAALLNGEIEIESAQGKGTLIQVRIPADFQASENAPI